MLALDQIFNSDHYTYDKIKGCYIPLKNNTSIAFSHIVRTQQQNVLFMIAVKYNSIRRPSTGLKINDKIVGFDLLNKCTSSDNKLLAVRIEQGPFYLKAGKNEIEIIIQGLSPEIYSIELYPYKQNINQTVSPFSYKMSDFVYLECYNLYGGFFWHINNFIICCYFADKFGKIPIVNFTNSLFMNNTSIENDFIKKNNNWFYNYFKNYADVPPSIYQAVINNPNRVRVNSNSISNYKKYSKFCNDNQVLEFRRECFLLLRDKVSSEKVHKDLIQKYLKPLPHIQNTILQIKKEFFPEKDDNIKFIGIHYRGTDKIEEEISTEQKPKHYNYADLYNLIVDTAKNLMKENNSYNIYIVACSDEQPFIDFLQKRLRHKLIYYKNATRSNISTSEVQTNFTKIPNRDRMINTSSLTPQEKQTYETRDKLIQNSIHMGMNNVSNYKKGLDCLIDVLLLDEVDILLKSKGNFSSYCEYFNKNENLKVLNIHEHIICSKKK
tara:strand:- start:2856 stop:4337 length:1482 start_codon:yes stop_codon:yes gene_type:complete